MNNRREEKSKGFSIILIIAIGAIIATFGWVAYATWQQSVDDSNFTLTLPFVKHKVKSANTNSAANTNSVVNSNTNSASNTNVSTAGWKTYANTTYGFTLKYPSKNDEVDDNHGSIRIQNYSSAQSAEEDKAGLKPDEFYLDISAVIETCTDVINGTKTVFGNANGYLGENDEGGDAGGYRSGRACVMSANGNIDFQVTEGDADSKIANGIFSTLTFTK